MSIADYEIISYGPRNFKYPEKSGNKCLHTYHIGEDSFLIELEHYKESLFDGSIGHIIIYYNNPPLPEQVLTSTQVRAEHGKDAEHDNI